ncbi:hypothetical protein KY285_004862 [Solanum tuberosum]|nr:hypothetical protein KY289_005301 [Solanum tuberosum]KAH0751714.1 hypothetical protein KY285_004862 [Solanum tuberosum]
MCNNQVLKLILCVKLLIEVHDPFTLVTLVIDNYVTLVFPGMARGRGRGKSSGRSNPAIRVSMPTIPKPTIVSPQQGGTPTNIETTTQSINPIISETPSATSNQSNLIGQRFSTQSNSTGRTNTIAECESNSSHIRTLVFLTSAGLELSQICSSFISKSFKSDVDPNGINWKGVSTDVRNGYFGEFKVTLFQLENIAGNLLLKKVEIQHQLNYICMFIHMVMMEYHMLVSVLELSIILPSCGGEKKRRIYGLGSEAKDYYGQNLCGSSSLPPPFSQSTSITNMDDFVKQIMPALTSHLVPIIVQQVQASITPSENPSIVTPIVPPATNVDEVDPSISSDDRIP